MFDYIAKIRRGTANVDIIFIIIGSTEVLFDSSICIIGYNTISNRDRIRYNMCSSSSGRNKAVDERMAKYHRHKAVDERMAKYHRHKAVDERMAKCRRQKAVDERTTVNERVVKSHRAVVA